MTKLNNICLIGFFRLSQNSLLQAKAATQCIVMAIQERVEDYAHQGTKLTTPPFNKFPGSEWWFLGEGSIWGGRVFRVKTPDGRIFIYKVYKDHARLLNDVEALRILNSAFEHRTENDFTIIEVGIIQGDSDIFSDSQGQTVYDVMRIHKHYSSSLMSDYRERLESAKLLLERWAKENFEREHLENYEISIFMYEGKEPRLKMTLEREAGTGLGKVEILIKSDNINLTAGGDQVIFDSY